jgi:hypothetical protein
MREMVQLFLFGRRPLLRLSGAPFGAVVAPDCTTGAIKIARRM